MSPQGPKRTPEHRRLAEDAARTANWKRWGPYLSERQWGTVREDYSADGNAWAYFPHEHARSRAYRWGEDGLLGITDRQCRLCFAVALWNERDGILKERLFGLTNPQGNHGEDVKESYFYVDSTPTHSYMKALYRYPQAPYPYERLVEENARRGRAEREFEIEDTGVFDGGRFFDVVAEYAKAGPSDLLIRLSVTNRGPDAAPLHLLPTLWFRNTWSWGRTEEGCDPAPRISLRDDGVLVASHEVLGEHLLAVEGLADGAAEFLFTDNETNAPKLFGAASASRWFKDAFHERVVRGRADAVRPDRRGTKAAAWLRLRVAAGATVEVRLRLVATADAPRAMFGPAFDAAFAARAGEADRFYATVIPPGATPEERTVARQAYAGLLWSKQFFHYAVHDWLEGDPAQPAPPAARKAGRNADWPHVHSRDVLSMPDKWEYPWFAAWDTAFHALPLARVDADFAKQQLLLLLREWYMHPNGQIPAYEWAFSDVNPPVHAAVVLRVFRETGSNDVAFLEKAFQKLVVNFTWWVNRKDHDGHHVFAGGFLGLDNIGVFDRSRPLPSGGRLEQADGTAWMSFYAASMLSIAIDLARRNPVYEDIASKFFEHFIAIADAMNTLGGTGLWDEEDGFYYDRLHAGGQVRPLRVRSLVGLVPLLAVDVSEAAGIEKLPDYLRRAQWFVKHRRDLRSQISNLVKSPDGKLWLLSLCSRERLERVLRRMLDEEEFLSPFGIRSVSRAHRDEPFVIRCGDDEFSLAYEPGESATSVFGGNSNWRGPVWFPLNYLMVHALRRFGRFYGDSLRVECPTGSGNLMNLDQVADEIQRRLASLFLPDASGRRPGDLRGPHTGDEPAGRDLVLFHEYFDGDTGRGLGANHQTGWTALVVRSLECVARVREARAGATGAAAQAAKSAPAGATTPVTPE